MNVEELLDMLEETLEEGTAVPFAAAKRVVDVDRCRDIVDEVRNNLPDELRDSKKIVADREQILKNAQTDADNIIKQAEERARVLVSDKEITKRAQKMAVELANETAQITNRYIIGEERSFTIIAFPVPEIGEQFEEIFAETVKINTLDYQLYQRIQQTIIDALDQGCKVHILGKDSNRTDLTVSLIDLKDPQKETIFENCVADVNIPVGEVFTSPRLAGTTGVLHVSEVYLEELRYENLEIHFQDGMVTDYTCSDFEDEEENKKYVRENVLFHHKSLPMGEFAIGTNTTAYVMAEKYGIGNKLPILIAEKMGPHFAVGDTCYSWSEDTAVYNPDGKEIIARDNEVSILRKEDLSKAYFGCHTDITIPYKELGLLTVLHKDGSQTPIIQNGRFILPGTEELNKPFANVGE